MQAHQRHAEVRLGSRRRRVHGVRAARLGEAADRGKVVLPRRRRGAQRRKALLMALGWPGAMQPSCRPRQPGPKEPRATAAGRERSNDPLSLTGAREGRREPWAPAARRVDSSR
eukprot:1484572-Pyramimonas_sp.AAC.1